VPGAGGGGNGSDGCAKTGGDRVVDGTTYSSEQFTFTLGTESTANATGNVVTANTTGTDGSILGFQKSGTTVGSIGTEGSRPYFIKSGAGGFSISSAGHIIPATSTGAVSDNTKDLGISTVRFRDLHLGGVAYTNNIRAAGGIVTTWKNEKAELGGNIIASNNLRNHKNILKLLKPTS
jgi:hypothetical protein